uniref:UBC core domain-containing protein n=1 Tax=Chromera velia CCMP2878 TaxID=1169474 RepID=A0A0G4HQ76_9ALVE|mmetsp:Transcript_32279/g.64081  ORF Transcript_32279/g.64081 Transcript_32279/m.64081 type:complete len:170 (+) Transcript_32279:259-768(+)|eukprot:Cvel_7899.t1-p1 / transcript=Cvel_7899.t1 / gene=Cvel_7899 / organism=Chromera_velia_CCMP2878 / gene_product=Ubiquitin-conjugating enzyme E2 15, putative / transcript_product=Ubiquitin-conjugating enzyme E2 15, putative / location=Cvel_scaffold423:60256-61988(+) / protein_length=169 / sequence_SO=supercontig / SO=protein_coding / is_pseudo=false
MAGVNVARELLKKQFMELNKDTDSPFSIGLDDDSNWFKWRVCFEGPQDTMWEGGLFTAMLTFPEDFPNKPPEMKFVNEMWHPNIYPDGRVCISILHDPGEDQFNPQERSDERWRPILGVESILVSVISMLGEPNLDSPANIDAAVHMKNTPDEYKKKVQRIVRKTTEGD